MINLVKNELIKIFHKKGLYVYGFLIILLLLINYVSDVGFDSPGLNDTYYNNLEESLKEYDLSDPDEADWYVSEKSDLDKYKILKDYDRYSPEYYYIDNQVHDIIVSMNSAKYLSKDEELYNSYKDELDEALKKLDSFDWKENILAEKQKNEELLEELKSEEQTEDTKQKIEMIGYDLEAIEFRLRNDVPPTYKKSSLAVDSYANDASYYAGLNKDDSSYKRREDLVNKKNAEREYYLSKYMIDNDIVYDDEISFQDNFIGDFEGVETFFIIAILIVAGGIFAEEFNKGTIKQLLIKPFSRSKIFISKLIAIAIATMAFLLFYTVVVFIYEAVSCGNISTLFEPVLEYNYNLGKVVEYNTFVYIIIKLLAILPELIILTLLCVFVGVLFTNTVGAVISVFGLQFFTGLLSVFLTRKLLSFLPMYCWDFTEFLFGGISSNEYITLFKSSVICIITIGILFTLSLLIFKNKDIKNQ